MDDDFEDQTKIMVIGVGGGGGNAVSHMVEGDMTGIDYVVANTDVKALRSKDGSRMRRIQIGKKRTRGQGAGNNPSVGQDSAEENRDDLKNVMESESMVFIAAGMGGGTGTGAAPVVASIAKEMGKLTVGVVTKPFTFEGQAKMNQALKGIAEMRKYVDSLIVIPNERVKEISNAKLSMADAFKAVDNVLYKAVKSISDLVKGVGFISLDFADVTMALKDSGIAHMAIGQGKGDNKNADALDQVLHSPLLETSISGARRLLISIGIPMTTSADEVDIIATEITKNAAPDAEIKMGMQFDDNLAEDEVSIIVIATDFLDDEHGEAEAQPAPASQPAASSDAVFGATMHKPVYDGTDADIDKLINLLNNNNN
ncbi:MAG TPA: cell division protein FtsZ [Ruminococcaceae bacterium]|nr:cell division protein FtsZ [Eubacterium sp.]HBM31965.1 cell division protein FtsZ [Oscillospiraceae bacterium]HCK49315.1 cell division protein FtsZ [Oscillospiraceae bacterium]